MLKRKEQIILALVSIKIGLYLYLIDLSMYYWTYYHNIAMRSKPIDIILDVDTLKVMVGILIIIGGVMLFRIIYIERAIKKILKYSITIVVLVGILIKSFTEGDLIFDWITNLLGHQLYAIIAITLTIILVTIESISFHKIIPTKLNRTGFEDIILDM